MDLINLEKMKVVDLRNELQTRGLDTKGVKAVLIERLRAHLEGGSGVVPPSPGTPGRRSRRTRSMTKSPSPSPVKKDLEPVLETLEEESHANVEEEENKTISVAEKLVEESSPQETTPILEKTDTANNFVNEENNVDANAEQVIEEEAPKEITQEQQTNGNEIVASTDEAGDAPEITSQDKEAMETETPQQPNKSIRDEIEENNHRNVEQTESINEEKQEVSPEKTNKELRERSRSRSTERRERHNKSHSKSRSRSRSPHNKSRSRSRSRSHSRSSKRRSGASCLDSPSKDAEDISTPEDEPTIEENQFGLSWFDSDLHLRIDPVTFLSAKPMSHDIYTIVWSGARTNYGVREGKVCFEVRLSEETHLNRDNPFRDEPHQKGFRVGFSMPSSSLLLGESANSFAYCESGRKATNGIFDNYAKSFQLDDVIGCYLDLDSTPCTIKYTLNGEDLGTAFEFDKAILGEDQALFPHVLTKGYEYEINLADNDNLLVNKERKIRKKRKIKKTEEKVSKEENPEEEKKINEEKSIEDRSEEKPDESKDGEQLQEQIENEEQKTEEAKPSEEINENKAENSEAEMDKVYEKSTEKEQEQKEEITGLNNDAADPAATVDEKTESENSTESKGEDEKHIEKENDEKSLNNDNKDDNGPSPVKRQKIEQAEEEAEDEYDEVHPVPRDHMSLLANYELIALIAEDKYIPGPQRPESRKDCEVILMIGLPGSGKTTWVLKHIKENPDKRYHVIGADDLIAKMAVDGTPRKTVHKGRFDRVYELSFNVLSSLEDIAAKRRRNFILDQANAYASAQRRKMKGFADFKRIAVVCVPNEEEHKRRLADIKEKGNAYTLKETTLSTLKGAFSLPSLEFSWFDDIVFADLGLDEAKEEIKKYNEAGKKALDESNSNREKRQRRDNYRSDNRRRQDDRRRYDNRNDSRWNDRRGGGGGGNSGYHHGGGGGGGGGSRWGSGGGGGGGYRNNFGGYKDDRGYGGGGGGGGGGRGYDNRNQRFGGGPQNWVQNNRNRYDDRSNRYSSSGGGGSGRYDSYGSGSRDYRSGGGDHRDNRDRRGGSSGSGGGNRRDGGYRSGGSSNQRDFRRGHRDTREDSRGGSSATSATASTSSNHKSSSVAAGNNGGYDKYNKNKPQANNWAQYQQQHQAGAVGQHQQQYWNYNMQGYEGQQQWETMNPQQQQQWMTYWQQQNGAQQAAGGTAADPNQYWSQYSYNTSAAAAPKK